MKNLPYEKRFLDWAHQCHHVVERHNSTNFHQACFCFLKILAFRIILILYVILQSHTFSTHSGFEKKITSYTTYIILGTNVLYPQKYNISAKLLTLLRVTWYFLVTSWFALWFHSCIQTTPRLAVFDMLFVLG